MSDDPGRHEQNNKTGSGGAGDAPELDGARTYGPTTLASTLERLGRTVNLSKSVMPVFAVVDEQRARLAQVVAAHHVGSGALEFLQNVRLLEATQITFIEASERLSRLFLGPSMISANLAAQTAGLRLASTLDSLDFSAFTEVKIGAGVQAESLRRVAELVEDQNRALSSFRPVVDIARSMSFAIRAWDDVVRVSTPERTPEFLHRIEVAGRGTGWTVQAGLLLTKPEEDDFDALHREAVATLGPAEASDELRLSLTRIDPGLSERLQGAWDRIYQGGAHASAQAAHSLMETFDWTLRTVAPDDDVLAWHTAERRPERELNEGRPTRTLRVRYAVRANPEKNSSLDLYLKSLGELVSAIQSPKHGREIPSHRSLAPIALSVEALLHFILID